MSPPSQQLTFEPLPHSCFSTENDPAGAALVSLEGVVPGAAKATLRREKRMMVLANILIDEGFWLEGWLN